MLVEHVASIAMVPGLPFMLCDAILKTAAQTVWLVGGSIVEVWKS